MPSASKTTASRSHDFGVMEGRYEELGGYTVGFETYAADADLAPLFVGLPDDRCQCAHLGYVLKGKVKFTFADEGEEVYETGEAYHAPPGQTPTLYAGTEIIEFSPTEPLQQTIEVVTQNMEAASA